MERLLVHSTAPATVLFLATDHLQGTLSFAAFPCGPITDSHPLQGKKYVLTWSPEYPAFMRQPSLLPFPHRYLWLNLSSIHFSCFSVDSRSTFIKLSRMFKCYGNLHRYAVKANDLCIKTELAIAERQQRRQSPNRSRWVPTYHKLPENIKARKNWLDHGSDDPQAGAPALWPHTCPCRGWLHSAQSSQVHEKTKGHLTVQHIIQCPLLGRKSHLCVGLAVYPFRKKMCSPRKWKSLIYPEILLGRNSVVFEYRWEIKDAGVLHSSLY